MARPKPKKSASPPRQPAPVNAPAPNSLITKLFAAAEQASPLAGRESPSWSEDDVRVLVDRLPVDAAAQFRGFIEQFAALGTHLKDAIKNAEAAKAGASETHQRLAAETAALNESKSTLDADRIALEGALSALEGEKHLFEVQQREVVAKERELVSREAEVRSGLFAEQQKALASLRQEVADLEAKRSQLPFHIEADRQALLNETRRLADEQLEQVRSRAKEIEERGFALTGRSLGLDRREEKVRLNEALIKARRESLAEEVRDGFSHELEAKDEQIKHLTAQRKALHDKNDRLQRELDDFADLRDRLGSNPQVLLDQLESLKAEKRHLDQRVQELMSNQSEDDAELLRSQRDKAQDRLTNAENELFDLRHRESDWKRSVTEREDWQRDRVALQKSRDLLADSVRRLQDEVDGLINRQKDATPFPELTRMDIELVHPAVADQPPALSSLVAELQARIAFAERGKELHYRREDLQLFVGGLAMSQLHILQGISGTGKTSLATALAKAVNGVCTTVPVQAGWRDRADLLGHYNAFEKRYYERNTLQAIYRAQTDADKDRLHIVLLDEMNLSRPEQYFAEFLSALELGEGDRWINLMEARPAHGAPKKFRDGRDVWLPPNLWFIGTANHDETTSSFADKTHDRAFVLDLPKHEPGEGKLRPLAPVTWQFSGLRKLFDDASRQGKEEVQALLQRINGSELTTILQDSFDLGWGNRLERQMARFVPVVIATGGSKGLAVDHLLCSRMFRDGKVIGRHDTTADDLKKIERALLKMWKDCGLTNAPERCLRQLQRDVQRLERGR
jgi:hypothetical protein